jgi:hypothetical protein
MTVFAKVLGSLIIWTIAIVLVGALVRGSRDQVPKSRYLIIGFLLFVAPGLIGVLDAWLFSPTDSPLPFAIAVGGSYLVCVVLVMFLLSRWRRA